MTVSAEVRELIRISHNYKCAYCGISEIDVGGLLEVEHFRPLSKGGTDALENLLYACTICNRYKSDYWAGEDVSENLQLLHPSRDQLERHILALPDGTLIGLTERGWFHIDWLHLNRPQLVKFRYTRIQDVESNALLEHLQNANVRLHQRVVELENKIVHLQRRIKELTDRN